MNEKRDDDDTGRDAAPSAFELLGGEARVRELADRFYDLMELEPAYRELRTLHPPQMEGSRDKLYWFLCGWLGGPQHYIERFGHPRLRARHLPFAIGIRERDQWMACMEQAMREIGVEALLAHRLSAAFMNTADWMRNKGG
ncbi:group II truncated hemoglobin [Aquabacterium sp. A7-Y]|uniref:group II truncated hemoglobin n=1 Tax=Aquabacterium sp. A7-Y TaxID=1349605 RepID=UPI00223E46E5|nr:group II truncated hemoglobin [Aquabacterium sp. A7-Y]MCW7538733.1 group II truncated hemoglobin [Aquabacterium sp. A7-Y]